MGIFSRIRDRNKAKRVERLLERDPSGVALAAAAEDHLREGEVEDAFELARQGIEAYPNSERVKGIFNRIKQMKVRDQIRKDTQSLGSSRNPLLFSRLATSFVEISETRKALEVCNEGMRRFPGYEGCFAIAGEIFYERFRKTRKPDDYKHSKACLEGALERSPQHYRASILLARLHLLAGAKDACEEVLNRIRSAFPEDEKSQEIRMQLRGEAKPKAQTIPKPTAPPPVPNQRAPAAEAPPEFHTEVKSDRSDHVALVEQLRRFDRLAGMMGAILVDSNGLVIGSRIRARLKELVTGALISSLFQASGDAARLLSMGVVEGAVFEGDQGKVTAVPIGELVLGVVTTDRAKPGLVDSMIDEFVTDAKNS